MATLKELRQGNKRWIGSGNKADAKLTVAETLAADDIRKKYNEDDYKSLTVPGQSKSIKELMDRYEKGRPIPTE